MKVERSTKHAKYMHQAVQYSNRRLGELLVEGMDRAAAWEQACAEAVAIVKAGKPFPLHTIIVGSRDPVVCEVKE